MGDDPVASAREFLRQIAKLPLAQAYDLWCDRHRLILREDAANQLGLEAEQYLVAQDA